MKKLSAFFMILTILLALAPCSFAAALDYSAYSTTELLAILSDVRAELGSRQTGSAAPKVILQGMKNAGAELEVTTVYTAENDLNNLLGRPGEYTGKADFSVGGVTKNTIETFASSEDCEARYAYLSKYADASLGPYGLEQYMYKSAFAILRISYDVTPDDAAEYEAAFYAQFS